MTKESRTASLAFASIAWMLAVGTVPAAEIKVLSGSAIEATMAELIPLFEKSTGHRVTFDFNGTIGGMADRVLKGEAADVVIVSRSQVDNLEKQGKVTPGSQTDIAKVGVGLFVLKGAPKPDIGTVEAFKRAMLAAKSIGYNDPAAGAPVSIYLIGLFERLNIAADMTPKTTVFKERADRFGAVARGDVEIGFNQVSEIVVTPSVDLVGPLPAAIQNFTLFAAGLVASSKEPDAGKALIQFLASPNSQETWRAKGFEAP
jgi:molybdate transport system substrate-binding protein